MDPVLASSSTAVVAVGAALFLFAALRNIRLAWQERLHGTD